MRTGQVLVCGFVRLDQRRRRLEDTAVLPPVRLQHVAHVLQHVAHVGSRGLELRLLALLSLRWRQLPPRHLVVDRDDGDGILQHFEAQPLLTLLLEEGRPSIARDPLDA
eukprot:7384627-Prymnesium_polylepis.1